MKDLRLLVSLGIVIVALSSSRGGTKAHQTDHFPYVIDGKENGSSQASKMIVFVEDQA